MGDVDAAATKLLSGAAEALLPAPAGAAGALQVPEDDSPVHMELDPEEEAVLDIQKILPKCCPNFIREKLREVDNDRNAALARISDTSYPKRPKPEVSTAEKEPKRDDAYWLDAVKRKEEKPTRFYEDNALQLLHNEFVEFGKPSIAKAFKECNKLYAIAWKMCYSAQTELLEGREVPAPFTKIKTPRHAQRQAKKKVQPTTLKEEVAFLKRYRGQMKDELDREKARAKYRQECEDCGIVLQCQCCYTDYVAEDIIQCPAGHLFCKTCTKMHVENKLGGAQGVPQLTCMSTDGCPEQLAPSELRRVLPEKLLDDYDKLSQKASIENILLAGACDTLEKCPFCDFVMYMDQPPEVNKIFVCQAKDCGKESCRLCKRENHIPLKCEEVETEQKEKHRLNVEEAMAEALIRECPCCKKAGIVTRFVKQSDCNKMTCPKCKGKMCYICREVIPANVGYAHFCQHPTEPGKACTKCKKCPLWAGSTPKELEKLEAARVKEAGEKANEEYKRKHADENLHEDLSVLNGDEAAKKRQKR